MPSAEKVSTNTDSYVFCKVVNSLLSPYFSSIGSDVQLSGVYSCNFDMMELMTHRGVPQLEHVKVVRDGEHHPRCERHAAP